MVALSPLHSLAGKCTVGRSVLVQSSVSNVTVMALQGKRNVVNHLQKMEDGGREEQTCAVSH